MFQIKVTNFPGHSNSLDHGKPTSMCLGMGDGSQFTPRDSDWTSLLFLTALAFPCSEESWEAILHWADRERFGKSHEPETFAINEAL